MNKMKCPYCNKVLTKEDHEKWEMIEHCQDHWCKICFGLPVNQYHCVECKDISIQRTKEYLGE